jgi:hypothetical protein
MVTQVNNANFGPAQAISVGASPFTWTNSTNTPVNVMVSGGTVTSVSISGDGATFTNIGLLGGQFHLNPGQQIQLVYVLAPTMGFMPV